MSAKKAPPGQIYEDLHEQLELLRRQARVMEQTLRICEQAAEITPELRERIQQSLPPGSTP